MQFKCQDSSEMGAHDSGHYILLTMTFLSQMQMSIAEIYISSSLYSPWYLLLFCLMYVLDAKFSIILVFLCPSVFLTAQATNSCF